MVQPPPIQPSTTKVAEYRGWWDNPLPPPLRHLLDVCMCPPSTMMAIDASFRALHPPSPSDVPIYHGNPHIILLLLNEPTTQTSQRAPSYISTPLIFRLREIIPGGYTVKNTTGRATHKGDKKKIEVNSQPASLAPSFLLLADI